MIAGAYKFAEGSGGITNELKLARMVDRFGAQSVFGRVMGAGEITRIMTAESVVRAFKSRAASANWAGWVAEHPGEAELLSRAAELADGE